MSRAHEVLLFFRLKHLRCALRESSVVEVVAATSVVPLPGAPPLVLGLVNVRGTLVPVLDIRPRLGLPPKPIEPADHFIPTRTADRLVALVVDHAEMLEPVAKEAIADASRLTTTQGLVSGLARLADGILLIHDPEQFLSEAEALELTRAMSGPQG